MAFTFSGPCAVACVVLGVATAVSALFHGHYWSATGLVIAGLMTGATFFLGFDAVQNTVPGFIGAMLFVATGWAGFVTESPGLDVEGQMVEVAVSLDVLKTDAGSSANWKSPALQRAAQRAGKICLLQGGTRDQMDAAVNGAKTIYYGPGATLADASIDLTQGKPEAADCLTTFRLLYAADPGALQDILIEHRAWLRSHDIGA